MKLQLSLFAKDLKGRSDPYAVVAYIFPEENTKPTTIGKTEVMKNSRDPDFTKIFILEEFELGKPMHILVTIRDEGTNKSLGCTIFEVGSILGRKGGILGKEFKTGGAVMAHVERCSGSGTLNLKMRGIQLKNTEGFGVFRKSDPFYELQRKRKAVKGFAVWDCVFRSRPLDNDLNPVWNDACVELSTLCNGNLDQKFQIAVLDFEKGNKHTIMGTFQVSVNELLEAVTDGAGVSNPDEVNTDKAFIMMNGHEQVGKVVVISASTTGIEESKEQASGVATETTEAVETPSATSTEEEGDDEIVVYASDDIVIAPDEVDGPPNFVDYVSGGCRLHVITAIDYTASNGDPRKEESLHHFKKDGMNEYETAISKICTILSEYDDDKKYPVWGFGAKKDGTLHNCFQCGLEEEVAGVEGILGAYKQAFKSGVVMSKPTDITQVIRAAGEESRKCLDSAMDSGNQEYSILIIFTNGNVHSKEETIAAIAEVASDPLSIVVVGVGPGDFGNMKFLNEKRNDRDNVLFVELKTHEQDESALSEATLKPIPAQLVNYFVSNGIRPNPPVDTDEIVIEPFSEALDVEADVTTLESGEVEVHCNVKPEESKFKKYGKQGTTLLLKQGKTIMTRQKKTFGRMQTNMQRKMNKMIDGKFKNIMPKF